MKRILLALLFVLAAVLPAHAYSIGDDWSGYGTPNYSSGPTQQIGPYNAIVCGFACSSSLAIVSSTGLPWNPSGTGYYLHIAPGSTSVPNAGPGVYFQPGHATPGWLVVFWFKYEGSITNSGGGPFVFRLNRSDGQTFGGDNVADSINSSGTYNVGGIATVNAFSSNTWYLLARCVQYGTSGTTGSASLYVSASPYTSFSNWYTATGTSIGSSGNWGAASFNFDNEFGTGTFDFGPWYMVDIGTATCPDTGANPFNAKGIMYVKNYFPTANATPLTFTPSAGTNFSNVNLNSVGANYNSTATNGNQDIFSTGVPSSQTGIVAATLKTSAEQDNVGIRIVVPTWKSGAGTVTNGTLGMIYTSTPQHAGSFMKNGAYEYYMDTEATSVFGGAWTAIDLGHVGYGLLQ